MFAQNSLHNAIKCTSVEHFWKRNGISHVEKFHIKYCKGLLGVSQRANNLAVMGEVGRFPFVISIIKSALKFLKHLEDVSNDRPLLKAAINEDKSLCQ